MVIKSSGSSLNFSEIESEFGQNSNRSLGDYRISETYGDYTTSLANGIPSTGEIKFSDFYNKRLNIVVDLHSGGTVTRVSARNYYNNGSVNVVGGWRSKPSSSSGCKVVVHVNKKIGSDKGSQSKVALRTGSWNTNTNLQVDIGSSGEVYGAGGNGGSGNAANGSDGSSAIGFQYSGRLINRGYVQAGYGGGGAGGKGYDNPDKNKQDHESGGGGGGGGAGYPNGEGGGGGGSFGSGGRGAKGSNSSDKNRGSGGRGGSGRGSSGGNGGSGGDPNNSPQKGGKGSGREASQNGGRGGGNGAAVRKSSGVSVTINDSGTIHGSTDASGVS